MSFPSSLSSDPSHDVITILVLQMDKVVSNWDISVLHCLNEIDWFLFHQFTITILDVNKSEITWNIRGNFDGLWVLILREVIINVVVVLGVNELEVQWYLSKSLECLTGNSDSIFISIHLLGLEKC